MNELIFTGKIISVSPTEEFTSLNGSHHKERTIVVETEEMYPQSAAVRMIDAVATQDYRPGMRVECHLNFRAQKSKNSDRYFNDLRAWRVVII